MEPKWRSGRLWSAVLVAVAAAAAVAADRGLRPEAVAAEAVEAEEVGLSDYLLKVVDFLWQSDGSSYQHVWPVKMFTPSSCCGLSVSSLLSRLKCLLLL